MQELKIAHNPGPDDDRVRRVLKAEHDPIPEELDSQPGTIAEGSQAHFELRREAPVVCKLMLPRMVKAAAEQRREAVDQNCVGSGRSHR